MTSTIIFQRGDIWMVDFGHPIGHEQGMERPAIIISKAELNNTAHIHGLLIAVPGTKTPQINPHTQQTRVTCIKVDPSPINGLKNTTYFMSEKLRSVSIERFKRKTGRLETNYLKSLEDCLYLVLDLFS
jgi:mRNA interferase MazF